MTADEATAPGEPPSESKSNKVADARADEADPSVSTVENAILETRGISKHFGDLVAVDEVNLSIEEGELHAIIGPNGAGKTTLFNLITGTLEPTAGRVYYAGEDITDLPIEDSAQRGMVRSFQSNQLFLTETVHENVRLAAQTAAKGKFSFEMFSQAKPVGRDRTEEILSLLNLVEQRDQEARNLSHGDQRRLGIAIMLATDPDTLLLDEPTSGMDPESTHEFTELIESIKEQFELTLLMIEHDMSVVLGISDRITVLHNGRQLATGDRETIQNDEDVQEAYLGGMHDELEGSE
jgi:branched-chain amino acid transport system ATP-binding protein